MPTTRNLASAIATGNLAIVQEILTPRDAQGKPLVDLNTGYDLNDGVGSYIDGTALTYSLRVREVHVNIFQTLLNVRDNNRNVVIDVNRTYNSGTSVIQTLLHCDLPIEQIRLLLQSLIDLRGPQGELVTNLRAHTDRMFPLLYWAINKKDATLVRILLDARQADGSCALNPNVSSISGFLIDYAISIQCNEEIITMLEARGARRGALIQRPEALTRAQVERQEAPTRTTPVTRRTQPQGEPTHNTAIQTPEQAQYNRAVRQFNQNAQNIHDPTVTNTIKGSIKNLEQLYGQGLEEDNAIAEIESLIENFDYSQLTVNAGFSNEQKKECAKLFFALLKERLNYTHTHTNLSFKKIYALLWKAVIDDSLDVCPDDIRRTFDPHHVKAPAYIIDIKKSALIEKFIQADQIYREEGGDRDICDGGSIHKLIEALDHAHTSVVICQLDMSVLPAAQETPKNTLKNRLRKLALRQQKKILAAWDNEDEESEAAKFRKEAIGEIEQDLKTQFGLLLTQAQRDDITGQADYFPIPVLHLALHDLIGVIKKIPADEKNKNRQFAISRLKKQAQEAYDEADRTYQEDYELLLAMYNNFKKLDEISTSIQPFSNEMAGVLPVKHRLQQAYTSSNNLSQNDVCWFEQKVNLLKEIQKLTSSIQHMQDYGCMLKKQGEKKGLVVINLANELLQKVNSFFNSDKHQINSECIQFKKEFSLLLHSKNKEMGQYRLAWRTIAKNIAIALTLVGNILIGANLIYTRLTTGRALFFFQKPRTTSEDNVERINQTLNNLVLSN